MPMKNARSWAATAQRRVGELTGYTLQTWPKPGTLEHHLPRVFQQTNIDELVDVGAYRGGFGLMARRSGYQGPIVSFEPAPTDTLLAAANADDRWNVRFAACSSERGTMT